MPRPRPTAYLVPIILTALLAPVMGVLLQGDALPCTHDDIFHTFRIVALRAMLPHGWVFSRWVPNLALGYGYPFFNYREPLPYWVGTLGYTIGLPVPLVLGLLTGSALIAAAWGAYTLGRDLFGERAGWVAGVAYGLSPYLLMDVVRRGNMPEVVGLALVPWLFVTTRRLILGRSRRSFVVTLSILIALFLSHNITSLLLVPFLGAYVILLSWRHRRDGGWPFAFLVAALAVLITAWFWLPALTEQDMVQLHLSRLTRNNDYHYNFIRWSEILALPEPHDPDYLNPPMRVRLGVVHGVLGILGAALGFRPRSQDMDRRWLVGLFAAAAVAYLALATPGSVWLWDALPMMAFVQFPWRLVGRALLPVCCLAGFAVEVLACEIAQRRRRPSTHLPAPRLKQSGPPDRLGGAGGLVLIAVTAIALLAWPTMLPPRGMCEAEPRPDLGDLYRVEQDGFIGIDPENSYFPIWVEEHPTDTALAEAFEAGDLPERFDAGALPEGGEILKADYRPLRASVTVASPETFRARWLGLYFPGWQVRVDGVRVAVTPEDDTGLMRFVVPAGEHTIGVRFGSTPMRSLGTGLSLVGVAFTAVLGLAPVLRRSLGGAPSRQWYLGRNPRLGWALLVLSVVLLLLHVGVVRRVATPVQHARLGGDRLPEVAHLLRQPFEGGMTLLGYTIGANALPSDGELAVDLMWQADQRQARNLWTSVLLRSADGQVWSPAGTARPRGFEPVPPTTGWSPGDYAYDGHIVTPRKGTPPGEYEVVVALFDSETLAARSPMGAGLPTQTDLVLGTVRVDRPNVPLTRRTLDVADEDAAAACGPIALLDQDLDRAVGVPGDLLALRWVWESLAPAGRAISAQLRLTAPDGSEAAAWTLAPSADGWPTDRWLPGDLWLGRHVVRLPGDLDGGIHTLAVTADSCDASLRSVPFEIVAPQRSFTVPSGLTPLRVPFGDKVALVAFSLTPPQPTAGDPVDVHLAWRALAPVETPYRVYLHLLDVSGAVVSQSDGEPAGWTRPTTGWAVDEVVSDMRRVTVPDDASGALTLRVGLYEPGGPRLLTADGDDGATVITLDLE